jgi:hypothetical protein
MILFIKLISYYNPSGVHIIIATYVMRDCFLSDFAISYEDSSKREAHTLLFFLLLSLIFLFIFDCLSHSKYLFKYVIL